MPSQVAFTPCKGIQARIQTLYDVEHSWIKVGDKLGVSPAMAWRVANQGYEPKDPEIRKKLGFPQVVQQTLHRNSEGKFIKHP